MRIARNAMAWLKNDTFVQNPPILMSQWIAQTVRSYMSTPQFEALFNPNTILVPIPKSSLMVPDALWVPQRLATALVGIGLGKAVATCLNRVKAVQKAAFCAPAERPTPIQHYETISVQKNFSEVDEIILIDDIITRGATLIGAANRLTEAFPATNIRAFAAMRTVSNPDEFKNLIDPQKGTITLRPTGDTLRRP